MEFYWLHFFLTEQDGVQAPPELEERLCAPCSGSLTVPSVLIQTARHLLQLNSSAVYPAAAKDHLLHVLLTELLVQREYQAPQDALAARIHEYIRSHAYTPLTVSDVAAALGYHADYLSRVLKNCYGVTLRQDIINERLSRAKQLLQTSDCTVAQISRELGYEDPNLFEKFFRYHLQLTPGAYRSSFSQIHTNHK